MENVDKLNFANKKEFQRLTNVPELHPLQVKVYPRRWFTLLLFVLFAAANNIQWSEYSIIENIMARYYNVSHLAIEWTTLIFSALFVILLIPISFMLHKLDLRYTIIIASVTTCIGSWIKVFSVSPDRFAVAFVGQSLVGAWQMTVLALPAHLAAYWFGPKEVATATALSNSGMTLGIAIFSMLVPMIVRNHESLEDVGNDLYILCLGVAIFCTIIALALIVFFRNEPTLPPSKSRALQKLQKSQDFEFFQPLWRVIKNKNFILLFNAHGLNIGALNTICTIMNPLYLAHFPNGEEDAGRIASVLIIVGTLGCVIFGAILDRLKKFKEMMIVLYVCTLLGEILFAVSLYMETKWAVYLTAAFLGLFMVAYMTVGYETCAEITYPESEGICMAVLNVANQTYSIIMVVVLNKIINVFGDMGVHVFLCVVLVVGLILTLITEDVQKRQTAMKSSTQKMLPNHLIVTS